MKSKSMAIIGAGTAGLSTAIFLSKQGFEIDLYEEFSEPHAKGAGILLQPQGLQVLANMGLVDEIISKSSKISSLFGQNKKSQIIMDFHYKDLCHGLFGLGIHRGALFDSLYAKASTRLNNLYLGQKVVKITQDNSAATVTTEHDLVKKYDVVVIANGTWSNLSKNLNIKTKKTPYPWGALWKIFECSDKYSEGMLSQRYQNCHTMAGMLPSGTDPNTQKQCISFFWSLKSDRYDDWKNTDIELWKNKVIELWPNIKPYINQITSHDDLTFAQYADTIMNRWHDNKIVVIGDAAHAMSPQLGQGANMALVDAWQLSQSIKLNKTIESGLEHYSKARKKHLRFYQYASRFLTPFFQSNSKSAAIFRDIVFPPMRYIPFAKKHALTTLFGVKTSVISNKPNINLDALAQVLSGYK